MKRKAPCGQGAGSEDAKVNESSLTSPSASGQLVDKYGNPHSEAIFRNWSPGAIKALGIHRVRRPEESHESTSHSPEGRRKVR
jgi:hypothetical protein